MGRITSSSSIAAITLGSLRASALPTSADWRRNSRRSVKASLRKGRPSFYDLALIRRDIRRVRSL
jgi:hypothetical protein